MGGVTTIFSNHKSSSPGLCKLAINVKFLISSVIISYKLIFGLASCPRPKALNINKFQMDVMKKQNRLFIELL